MTNTSKKEFTIISYVAGNREEKNDFLATEEPLEIQLEYGPAENRETRKISITMRTPGEDEALASGFLLTEGIISGAADIDSYKYPNSLPGIPGNYIVVSLVPSVSFQTDKLNRNFYTTSSCGVCGKASIDAITSISPYTGQTKELVYNPDVLHLLPERLAMVQSNFKSTGGLHASAIFDMDGNILDICEDVGRHNALDKLIGKSMQKNQLPMSDVILLLSGRASFELIQKAAMAGIRVVCAVGAPSSLAVETARECGITLIGFLRDNRYNVYSRF